jgi:hypothetical protein
MIMIIIFPIILISSIAGILYIIHRKIPLLLKYPKYMAQESSMYQNFQEKMGEIKEKTSISKFWHEIIIPKIEKILRKFKVVILKLDNFLAKKVDKMREKIKRRENGNDDDNDEILPL